MLSKAILALEVHTVYKELLSKSTPMLEVQTIAFWRHPYAGGTKSCFLNQPLRCRYKHWLYKSTSLLWRYKQLVSEVIPTLEVQTFGF